MSFDPNIKTVVLLAEDDENDIMLFTRAIKSVGMAYEINSVRDGQNAIDYLQRTGPYEDKKKFPFPRFLILDLKMPRKSGFEVLEWLQEHPECKVIPTIVFSSSKIAEDIKRVYQLGANSYFTKPNDYEELKTIFRLMLGYWEKANVPPIPVSQSCV
jgi:CheY-like chemotaxis protein